MYGFLQTAQAPLQFVWCSDGLEYNVGAPTKTLRNSLSTTPVYISVSGGSPSVYTNQSGTLSYTFAKAGATTGTTSGTADSNTAFSDSTTSKGTTSYTLKITDANTGQENTYLNSVNWAAV
jgi:hypothetical protein